MGPFDRKADNSFDRMFDLDGDGYMSGAEDALKYSFLSSFDEADSDMDGDLDDFDDFE